MKSFGSDNHSGVHSSILAALAAANEGHCPAYGDDPHTERLKAELKRRFGCADSCVVFNGTGANVLALKVLTDSWNAVICAATAHIQVDECGAPEKHTGCKLLTVETPDGKLTPERVRPLLHGFGFQHHAQPRVISISQPTELGTLYTLEEMRALADLAHAHGMYLHVDGARLANALAATGCTPEEMTRGCGADAVSLGGTKNGLMVGEAVLFFREELCGAVMYERKQMTQLASKMRFVSAQLNAYLEGDLYIRLAERSNRAAAYLAERLERIPQVRITQPVQTNAVFAVLPAAVRERLMREYCFYIWNEETGEVRWMTSFDTERVDVDAFADRIEALCRE